MFSVDNSLMIIFGSDAFDTEKLLGVMEKLRHDQAVDIPKYDFKSCKNDVFPARRVIFLYLSAFCISFFHFEVELMAL